MTGEFLRCYCGEEVACYHKECLAMVEPDYADHHDRLYNGKSSVAGRGKAGRGEAW